MKKNNYIWFPIIVILTGILSVFFTERYFRNAAIVSDKTYIGTYQFQADIMGQSSSMAIKNYLSIAYAEGDEEGEFTIYNSQNGVIQTGKCQLQGEYIALDAEGQKFILFCVNNHYYFVMQDLKPEILDKVDNAPIE